MTELFPSIEEAMKHAAALATTRIGYVEPNPAVGAVVVDRDGRMLGAGCHMSFGEAHAEVNALAAAGASARDATLVVTLEPCCHHGQTPPCVDAVIAAGISRVVVGIKDPSPHASGAGLARLRDAGIEVEVGVCAEVVRQLNAPFLHHLKTGRPWVQAKWAMTLDGRIASRTGHSQWISGDESRALVHELRGRVDAIVVGIGTVVADDPMLTARPPGPRAATRVVLDSRARLSDDTQLVQTAADIPVMVVCSTSADPDNVTRLMTRGVEVVMVAESPDGGDTGRIDLEAMWDMFGLRKWTNVLVEGGGGVLGGLVDGDWVDEAHVFLAPKLLGGKAAVGVAAGVGRPEVPDTADLVCVETRTTGADLYWRGVRALVSESDDC